ncbi:MAG: tRNA preQ1(34) S-adenosylmethionine ribosyltransferase-isomerase QueA [Gemmatimonadota bacterium]|nr:tRNA preQ1(34) S-adenosylmethionine ribosyltransferase-isomerase QueA [Gemmatimonadota bacterium]
MTTEPAPGGRGAPAPADAPAPATAPERTADFDYELPPRLIARRPAARRDASRLLVLDRATGAVSDRRFTDLPDFLAPGDVLVLNDTRVFPARLVGRKPTGAPAEVLLLRPAAGDPDGRAWEALVRPGGKLKPGRVVEVAEGFAVRIEDSRADGSRRVRLEGEGDPRALIERHGRVPLPPYLRRDADEEDRVRYQTVYAAREGSVAAPTAGLHFTPELLARIEARGVAVERVTLHVGVGTFRPVDAERPADHRLHAEWWEMRPDVAERLVGRRAAGGRVWAVGTTAARTLETAARADGTYRAGSGWTDLFIYPPYDFRGLDGLLTNFHLPRSSLLMLVAALAGTERVLAAYRHAAREAYRFYSYGDAMLVE